jgi:DNA-binding NtrC family response regulator
MFQKIREKNNFAKIIGVIGSNKVRGATKLLGNYLDDFLVKDSDTFEDKLKVLLKDSSSVDNTFALDLFYCDPNIKKQMDFLKKIIKTNVLILLEGETDCEYELYAKIIHKMRDCDEKKFYPIFCPTLTKDTIFENDNPNNLLNIKNGTIFLENINSTSEETQNLLIKFIDTIEKNNTPQSNIKIIANSIGNLREEVENGNFKNELFYKINGFTIEVTSLKNNREAIPMLVKDLYQLYAKQEAKSIRGITNRGLKLLENYDWPGNVRELKNVMHNAVAINSSGILDEDDFINLRKQNASSDKKENFDILKLIDNFGNPKSLKDLENEIIAKYIDYFDGNITKVSKYLGIGRATLYRKIEENV